MIIYIAGFGLALVSFVVATLDTNLIAGVDKWMSLFLRGGGTLLFLGLIANVLWFDGGEIAVVLTFAWLIGAVAGTTRGLLTRGGRSETRVSV